MCMQCVYIPTELPFCIPPLVVGWEKKKGRELSGRVVHVSATFYKQNLRIQYFFSLLIITGRLYEYFFFLKCLCDTDLTRSKA